MTAREVITMQHAELTALSAKLAAMADEITSTIDIENATWGDVANHAQVSDLAHGMLETLEEIYA